MVTQYKCMHLDIPTELLIYVICALIGPDGYDCDEKWVIYMYPQVEDVFEYCYPGQKVFHLAVDGCATFDDDRGYNIIVGSNMNEISHTGDIVWWHEIMHLQCLCDFHGNPPEVAPEAPRR